MKELVADLLPSWLAGDPREQLLYVLTLGLLGVGTFLCALALRVARLDASAVALASGGAAAWLLSNKPAEGQVLYVVRQATG